MSDPTIPATPETDVRAPGLFEIVNPSDMYTIEGPFEAVAVATMLVGCGHFGLTELGGTLDRRMPIFLGGQMANVNAWWRTTFGRPFEDTGEDGDLVNQAALAAGGVLLGDAADRATYLDGLALIDDPAKRQAWRDRWDDTRRSGMNRIGHAFWALGRHAVAGRP